MAMAPACVLLLLLAAAVASSSSEDNSAAAPLRQLPSKYKYRLLTSSSSKRRQQQQLTCTDPVTNKAGCMASCDARCPNQCIVLCPDCLTYCICDLYPGMSCGDPRFTGGDGNTFYFHGAKDRDFCILSDAGLHINAHFIGKRNPAASRDFTWIQALGIRFAHHRLYVGAQRTAKWSSDVDRLELALDGEPIRIAPHIGAAWRSAAVPGLTVTRTAAANGVRVQLRGVLDAMANAVPVSKEDSRAHSYGVTEDDCLAHLDLGLKFYDLTQGVHGVLGQTYRPDYVNRLSVSSNMPVMGGAAHYLSSDIFAVDCAVATFDQAAMLTARA